jgi:hypothetical protein
VSRRRVFAGRDSAGNTKSTSGFSTGIYVTPDGMLVEKETAARVDEKRRKELGWIFFRSKREAKVWIGLKQQESAGLIRNLRRQVKWPLHAPAAPDPGSLIQPPAPIAITSYTADFVYEQGPAWFNVVADAKGFPNDTYPIKKKWMAAEYGIHIQEL